jgi:hypothetical protein
MEGRGPGEPPATAIQNVWRRDLQVNLTLDTLPASAGQNGPLTGRRTRTTLLDGSVT